MHQHTSILQPHPNNVRSLGLRQGDNLRPPAPEGVEQDGGAEVPELQLPLATAQQQLVEVGGRM